MTKNLRTATKNLNTVTKNLKTETKTSQPRTSKLWPRTTKLRPRISKLRPRSSKLTKNLFVICVAYYLTYLPVTLRIVLSARGMIIPDALQLIMTWIYQSSSAVNAFLYIALHSSVRRELRRYLPRCRHNTVAPATIRPVGDGGHQRHCDIVNTDAGAPGAPAIMMTSSCRRVTDGMVITELWRRRRRCQSDVQQ